MTVRELPKRDSALDNPKTEFEKLVAKLDSKLSKLRTWNSELEKSVPRDKQDLSEPKNWLVIASQDDINKIKEKWNLPSIYLDFLTRFSPLDVNIYAELFVNFLALYGASDLIKYQIGYSSDANTGEILNNWPKDYMVIADDGADPYIMDISQSNGEDAPILYALHGTGRWDFKPEAESFYEFLEKVVNCKWEK